MGALARDAMRGCMLQLKFLKMIRMNWILEVRSLLLPLFPFEVIREKSPILLSKSDIHK